MLKLREAKIGTPVKMKDMSLGEYYHVGHITGFAENALREIVIKVKLSSGTERVFHPSNVSLIDFDAAYYDNSDKDRWKLIIS